MLEAGLIDADNPANSLLLRKPTQQVKHGGGQKMVVGDRSYKQFRRFLDDYAATAAGKYRSAEALPQPAAESSVVSEIWLKLTDVPEQYDGKLLQVDLYRWEVGPQPGWSKTRWATADRPVFGKGRLWQHSLSLIAPAGSPRDQENRRRQRLPAGKYLARIYVDVDGKLAKDYRAELGADDQVGEVEIDSRWPEGYGKMTVARFVVSKKDAD